MPSLLNQVRQTIARYHMLPPGCNVGIAVSGGADSLCLLYALFDLRSEFDLHLSVIHLDHSLRGPESQADAQFVHKSAQQLGLPFHFRKLDLDPAHGNLEQEARRARYRFFSELIAGGSVEKIALGHTRSDQAETVLYRLLRGAGSAGLAGIRPVTDSGIVRPLIQVTRPQVEDWLNERRISWREDLTNRDLSFDRNRIRHQLLPSLEAGWNPKLSSLLAQTADWAFEEERFWRNHLLPLIQNWVRFAEGSAVLDLSVLHEFPVAAARRLIREIVRQTKHDLLGVDFAHIEAIRALAGQASGSGRLQIPGVNVQRSFHWLRFVNSTASPSVPYPVIELDLIPYQAVYNRGVNALDWEKVREKAGGQLILRDWRPGDEYHRSGHSGPQKIKALFQENSIPSWERCHWPILAAADAIVWASRFGPAAQVAVEADTRTVLLIRESKPNQESARPLYTSILNEGHES